MVLSRKAQRGIAKRGSLSVCCELTGVLRATWS